MTDIGSMEESVRYVMDDCEELSELFSMNEVHGERRFDERCLVSDDCFASVKNLGRLL